MIVINSATTLLEDSTVLAWKDTVFLPMFVQVWLQIYIIPSQIRPLTNCGISVNCLLVYNFIHAVISPSAAPLSSSSALNLSLGIVGGLLAVILPLGIILAVFVLLARKRRGKRLVSTGMLEIKKKVGF